MKLWQGLKNWAFLCLVAEEWVPMHQWGCPCSRLNTRVMRDQPLWGLGAHRRCWHILCLDTGKASPEGPPWPSLSMKDVCEWEVWYSQSSPSFHGETGQAVVSLHSATLFLVQGSQELSANPDPPYRWQHWSEWLLDLCCLKSPV